MHKMYSNIIFAFFQVTHGLRPWLMQCSGVLLALEQPLLSSTMAKTLLMLQNQCKRRRWTEFVIVQSILAVIVPQAIPGVFTNLLSITLLIFLMLKLIQTIISNEFLCHGHEGAAVLYYVTWSTTYSQIMICFSMCIFH